MSIYFFKIRFTTSILECAGVMSWPDYGLHNHREDCFLTDLQKTHWHFWKGLLFSQCWIHTFAWKVERKDKHVITVHWQILLMGYKCCIPHVNTLLNQTCQKHHPWAKEIKKNWTVAQRFEVLSLDECKLYFHLETRKDSVSTDLHQGN